MRKGGFIGYDKNTFFSGSKEAVNAWKDAGVKEILTADDDRNAKGLNYDLEWVDINELAEKHTIFRRGIKFTRTDIRIENIYLEKEKGIKCKSYNQDEIVIFTHEKYLNERWMRPTVEELINTLYRGIEND